MKQYIYINIALVSFILIGCGGDSSHTETIPQSKSNQTITGKTISIADGDTFTMVGSRNIRYKIRLDCIDTPEKEQNFGDIAKDALDALIKDKIVTSTHKDTDRYGRILGEVRAGGVYVNLQQVRDGMAWVYRQYCNSCEFYEAEQHARDMMIGLWSQSNPIPPWEYRKDPKNAKNTDWSYLYNDNCQTPSITPDSRDDDYSCGNKNECTQINSCDEAYFYYESCGLNRLDRNNNGVPCESLCY